MAADAPTAVSDLSHPPTPTPTDAPTTILDLPDDMLHEIFGHVFDEPTPFGLRSIDVTGPPQGAHRALRCVCRRWRDAADFARLVSGFVHVAPADLANVDTVRARHPTAMKALRMYIQRPMAAHDLDVPRAFASLARSADFRRALKELQFIACCMPAIAQGVPPIASCTGLTSLALVWYDHARQRGGRADMLAPLSALTGLRDLHFAGSDRHTPALPALPDAPRLTGLAILTIGLYPPIGSDAALGRLRALSMSMHPTLAGMAAEDPFALRAALDNGTWQPHKLTSLQVLKLSFTQNYCRDPAFPRDRQRRSSPVGAEWAPLASQITSLSVLVGCPLREPPSTGIVAGLGVLTALRTLYSLNHDESLEGRPPSRMPFGRGSYPPIDIARVRAPALTRLYCDSVTDAPINVAAFARVEEISVGAKQPGRAPLALRSIAAHQRLRFLNVVCTSDFPPTVNLADMFVDGRALPALTYLRFSNCALEWDATGMAAAPTAAAFAGRARQLLPRLVSVTIQEPTGRDALPDRSRVASVLECRRNVVPALIGLHGGKAWEGGEREA